MSEETTATKMDRQPGKGACEVVIAFCSPKGLMDLAWWYEFNLPAPSRPLAQDEWT